MERCRASQHSVYARSSSALKAARSQSLFSKQLLPVPAATPSAQLCVLGSSVPPLGPSLVVMSALSCPRHSRGLHSACLSYHTHHPASSLGSAARLN